MTCLNNIDLTNTGKKKRKSYKLNTFERNDYGNMVKHTEKFYNMIDLLNWEYSNMTWNDVVYEVEIFKNGKKIYENDNYCLFVIYPQERYNFDIPFGWLNPEFRDNLMKHVKKFKILNGFNLIEGVAYLGDYLNNPESKHFYYENKNIALGNYKNPITFKWRYFKCEYVYIGDMLDFTHIKFNNNDSIIVNIPKEIIKNYHYYMYSSSSHIWDTNKKIVICDYLA